MNIFNYFLTISSSNVTTSRSSDKTWGTSLNWNTIMSNWNTNWMWKNSHMWNTFWSWSPYTNDGWCFDHLFLLKEVWSPSTNDHWFLNWFFKEVWGPSTNNSWFLNNWLIGSLGSIHQ